MKPTVHVGIVRGEQLPQHVAERDELLADDRSGEAAGAQQLGSAEAVRQVRAPAAAGRAATRSSRAPAPSRCSRSAAACAGGRSAAPARCGRRRPRPAPVRSAAPRRPARDATNQKSGRFGSRISSAQLVLRLAHQRLRDDQALAPLRDFRAGRHEIERRRLADVDARPVVRARARATGRATAAAPTPRPAPAPGSSRRAARWPTASCASSCEADVGDPLVRSRRRDLRAERVDLEIAQQRLRHDRLQRRRHRRIEVRQRAARVRCAASSSRSCRCRRPTAAAGRGRRCRTT